MLVVPTYVAPSSIRRAGTGLFATTAIARSATVWKLHPKSFLTIGREEAALLPDCAFLFLRTYATLRESGWMLAWDNGRFINHSDGPNLIFDHAGNLIAARDIASDEELTEDYRALGEVEPLAEGDPAQFGRQS